MAAVTLAVGAIAYHSSGTSSLNAAQGDRAGLMAADLRPSGPAVPANLAPPAGLHRIGAFSVVSGTQTYTCANGSFAGASVPEAVLAGPAGKIHHFAGPSWESVSDHSLVTATKTAESAVTGSIPQLLLTVNSHSGTTHGLLSRVQNIQRLNTSGGAAPTTACTDGAKTSVPYHATYVLWAS
jgi:hypothetical protein